jgi:hypothetical protein
MANGDPGSALERTYRDDFAEGHVFLDFVASCSPQLFRAMVTDQGVRDVEVAKDAVVGTLMIFGKSRLQDARNAARRLAEWWGATANSFSSSGSAFDGTPLTRSCTPRASWEEGGHRGRQGVEARRLPSRHEVASSVLRAPRPSPALCDSGADRLEHPRAALLRGLRGAHVSGGVLASRLSRGRALVLLRIRRAVPHGGRQLCSDPRRIDATPLHERPGEGQGVESTAALLPQGSNFSGGLRLDDRRAFSEGPPPVLRVSSRASGLLARCPVFGLFNFVFNFVLTFVFNFVFSPTSSSASGSAPSFVLIFVFNFVFSPTSSFASGSASVEADLSQPDDFVDDPGVGAVRPTTRVGRRRVARNKSWNPSALCARAAPAGNTGKTTAKRPRS